MTIQSILQQAYLGVLDHTFVSLAGSLLGILLGIGVSIAAQNWSQRIYHEDNRFTQFAPFIPWRSSIVGLILLNLYPLIPIILFGIGNVEGIFSVAYVIFFLTIIIFFQSPHHNSDKPIIRLLPWFRTIAVFSVILTTHYGSWGSGGLGFMFYQKLGVLEYSAAWSIYWVICGVAFIIDEFSGLVQWFIDSRSHNISSQSSEAGYRLMEMSRSNAKSREEKTE